MKFKEAKEIYNNLIISNKIWFKPFLKLDNSIVGLNAHADLKTWSIYISSDCLKIYNEDEMAFTLSHELGHFYYYKRFQHIFFKSPDNEYQADLKGFEYASCAGYDMRIGIEKFKKWPSWKKNISTNTHPGPQDRYNRLKALL